jgi:hypothetical protein
MGKMKSLPQELVVLILAIFVTACASGAPIPTGEPQPTGSNEYVAFIFHREGGIAGFCDDLIVYISGKAEASSCAGQESVAPVSVQLTPDQQADLKEWTETLQPFEFDQTDPATVDALTIRIQFFGTGESAYTDADLQAIQEMAQDLLAGAMSTP